MEVKRNQCVILPLVLKKKWYDMIASGVKKEEYRTSKSVCRMIERWFGEYIMRKDNVDHVVTFYLGYQKDRPSMSFRPVWVGYEDKSNHPEWGEPEGKHCVIELGEQVTFIE